MRTYDDAAFGRLPEDFGSTTVKVSEEMSAGERMPTGHLEGYLATGQSALKAVRLAQLAARVPDFTAILDLPCGHGRVTRWFQAAYPHASLTACDILTDGVDFCADAFGATPVYSRPGVTEDAFLDRYDLIWVGSLFTHVDVPDWDHLIALFDELSSAVDDRTLEIVDRRRRTAIVHRRGWLVRRMLLAADVIALVAALLVAEWLVNARTPGDFADARTEILIFLATIPVWVVVAKLYGLYERD